ncbi:MAG TPA: hypothetical protein VKH41_12410 [Myxococcota bacterium]|nr:hypothetical protein [Myxococcota bacterium]
MKPTQSLERGRRTAKGLLSKVTEAGRDAVRRVTNAEKAPGHRRVTRRADSALSRRRKRGSKKARRSSKMQRARSSKARSRR